MNAKDFIPDIEEAQEHAAGRSKDLEDILAALPIPDTDESGYWMAAEP